VTKKSLSPIKYTGQIHFHVDCREISEACDGLLKFVNEQTTNVVPVGFDMEWPFNFSTGPQKTALIQLCAELDKCYLFHVTKLQKLPQSLMTFLNHSKIRWHGVNIKNDFRKLQRDFPEVNSQALIDQCIDLGPYCNSICSTSGRWSMERLVAYVVSIVFMQR
jgi:werner syndrome-like exonuclease